MGSFFFAMAGLRTFAEVLLYVGLALALMASVLYARTACASCARRPSGRWEVDSIVSSSA